MFTGGKKHQVILQDVNIVENGVLFEKNVHAAFRNHVWGIETKMENGSWQYFIKAFQQHIFFYHQGVGNSTELHFSNSSGHNLLNPDICALHLAVCTVTSACSVADVFNKLFENDPDIIRPISGESLLPGHPDSECNTLPYFEQCLLEESMHVPL